VKNVESLKATVAVYCVL